MLDIQKIIDKIIRIKNFKIKSFEIIFDELDEIISELQEMKEEMEKTDSDDDYSFNTNDIKALRHYVKYLKK